MLELLRGEWNALCVPKLVDKTDRTTAEYKKIARSETNVIDARKNVGDGSVIALNVGYRIKWWGYSIRKPFLEATQISVVKCTTRILHPLKLSLPFILIRKESTVSTPFVASSKLTRTPLCVPFSLPVFTLLIAWSVVHDIHWQRFSHCPNSR